MQDQFQLDYQKKCKKNMTAVEGNKSAKKTTSVAARPDESAEERDKENDDQNCAEQNDAKTSDVSESAFIKSSTSYLIIIN